MDRILVLVRHGQSEWNLKNLFTGWKNPDLTEQGVVEAKTAGRKLKAAALASMSHSPPIFCAPSAPCNCCSPSFATRICRPW